MVSLKIDFDEKWVGAKRAEGVRVVRAIEKWIASDAGLRVKLSSASIVVVELDGERLASFEEDLARKIAADFGVEKPNDVLSCSVTSSQDLSGRPQKGGAGEKTAEKPVAQDESHAVDEKPAAEGKSKARPPEARRKGSPAVSSGTAEAEPSGSPSTAKPSRGERVLSELLDAAPFKYSRELSAYLRETAMVVPMLQKMSAVKSFWNKSLLVAIDDGYGMTDFLRSLVRLYSALGISKDDPGERTVREVRIGVGAHESCLYEDWERAVEISREMRRANEREAGSRPVLSLDVGPWQDKLLRGDVKAYLRKLNANGDNFMLVFRIPFVEARTMNAAAEALGDIFSIRPLVVPPTSLESLASYAREQLARRDFTLADDAMEGIEKMILNEKRDDSFFGFKTVDKLVDEIIYGKAMENCRAGMSSRDISRADVAACLSGGEPQDGNPRRELEALVGLEAVKEKVSEIVAQIKTQRRLSAKGRSVKRPAIHMLFTGNPGTGKTTVARIVARLLRDEGILRKGHLIEVKGRDLCGEYVGQTAPKTSAICRDAYGSVLFIDEAYSLFRGDGNDRDYGREALDTLIAEMENHREDLCVIMAGYTDEMETMLGGNPGLKSRIPFTVDFPNYTKDQLGEIFFSMVGDNFEYEKPLENAVRSFFDGLPDDVISDKGFSNARFVRNLYERTWGKAAYRSRLDDGEIRLLVSDLAGAAEEREFKQLLEKTVRKPIGFGAWAD